MKIQIIFSLALICLPLFVFSDSLQCLVVHQQSSASLPKLPTHFLVVRTLLNTLVYCHHWRHQHHQRHHQRRHTLTLFACLWGQMQRRQVAFVAQRMGQWEPIIDHTHPPIYTSDTTVRTHPLLYSREVTVLIAGGGVADGLPNTRLARL